MSRRDVRSDGDGARTIGRRDLLALVAATSAIGACAGARPAPVAMAQPAEDALEVDPIVDLVPASGLGWLVQLRPRAMLANPVLASAVQALAPEELFVTFALRHGGVDLRYADEVVVAGEEGAILGLARVPVDAASVEAAFAARAVAVDGRAVEHGVTRFWGTVGDDREQVALFGRKAVGLERGRLGPLRVATYFAAGKIKRSLPALHAEPLAAASTRVGEAPIRGFAPGPFEGAWAKGFGGLLRATTAAAVSLRALTGGAVALRLVLTGAWGADGPAAAERLGVAFRVLAQDALGRLAGIDRPVDGPTVRSDATGLELEVALDPVQLARGLRAATGASLAEIMAL
jgi:hypothetical protein